MIVLQPSGENTIFVVPGANGATLVDQSAGRLITASGVLVAQLEIPLPAVADGIAAARAARTRVVDTTGAGDTFVGVLAAALCRGLDLATAVRWGVAAGAVAVERPGAVPAIPSLAEIEERLTVD